MPKRSTERPFPAAAPNIPLGSTLICTLGESDFVLVRSAGAFQIWSESAGKGVTFEHLRDVQFARERLREYCAKFPLDANALADGMAAA